MKSKNIAIIALAMIFGACQNKEENMDNFSEGSFGYDLEFLADKDSLIVLKNNSGNAQIIVSPKYQGKVFTSTADGTQGKSFGWVNYDAFEGDLDPHMNGYGGEDRLWLGPEGGKYSIFFKPGTEMTYTNWHTPPAFDSESWTLESVDEKNVSMSKDMQLQNYAGTELSIKIDRNVRILENEAIENILGVTLGENVKAVGFQTDNSITNAGEVAWTKEGGAPVMWNLDMFAPSPKTVIVIPYHENAEGKIATTDYFGQIPEDRIVYRDGTLLFKADGKSRGKLGISPQRAKPVAGSYDADNKILTITSFDVDNNGTYLNQEWTPSKDPFIGDAVNAYNDGPLEDGTQMGPFYEIESVSPVAYLSPGAKVSHQHSVFHFIGDDATLNLISEKVLGISLSSIESAFN